jgi:transcriptional regulator with XRE-family HTH domain
VSSAQHHCTRLRVRAIHPPIDVQLGKRLRSRRRVLQLTLVDLADLTGINAQQLQKYECAATRMSAAMMVRLAVALEVQVGYFFDGLVDFTG